MPRARRARLDLPGQGPQRQRPLGGAQGPAQHRGRGRDGGRRRRGAVPRPARAPEHRPHLQLRAARQPARRRDRRLHRDGVRRRQVTQADPARRAPARRRGAARPRARLRPGDPARVRLPARPGLVYCDFKPDNVIQTEEQLKLIDMGGVRVHRRRRPDLRDGRLPGAGDRDRGAVAKLRPLHRRPDARGAHLRLRRLPGAVPVPAARLRAAARRSRSPSPGCCAAPRTATRPAGSSRRARWPSS